MRSSFADEILSAACSDDRVVVLSGDIGNQMFDDFQKHHPDRFYNCGIAEANMIGMAAGLAMSGLRPFVYTFSAFDTIRCLEQIRIDLCFQKLPVVIIGLGGGLTYAPLGPTHYICEDIAALRTLPNIIIVAPADAIETRFAIRQSLMKENPVYIRIGKKNEPVIHSDSPDFTIGKGLVLREGSNVCLISAGTIMPEVLKAADILIASGISVRVVNLHTIKPLDQKIVKELFETFPLIGIIEEHSLIGGLSSSILEWAIDEQVNIPTILRFGTADEFIYDSITQNNARIRYGITAELIAKKIQDTWMKQNICR